MQIAAGTTSSAADAKTWNMARGQFALGKFLFLFFPFSVLTSLVLFRWVSWVLIKRHVAGSVSGLGSLWLTARMMIQLCDSADCHANSSPLPPSLQMDRFQSSYLNNMDVFAPFNSPHPRNSQKCAVSFILFYGNVLHRKPLLSFPSFSRPRARC